MFTKVKTDAEVREMRKELLAKLMPEHEGETWCASKHLLSAAMRLMEVGTKLQSDGKTDEAKQILKKAQPSLMISMALRFTQHSQGAFPASRLG